ncbi:hypothetical protein QQF64_022312 [Cirrhinus molitorella]|uniref:Uncharacterized protein n=1 Tax=Cirrhinus molitorella TaxID=172907 RepID=A0ABR3LBC9_9TELE
MAMQYDAAASSWPGNRVERLMRKKEDGKIDKTMWNQPDLRPRGTNQDRDEYGFPLGSETPSMQRLRVYVCVHTHSLAPTAPPGTQTHFTCLSKVILLFSDRPTEERESQRRGKRARRGVSQANTKGYCTHSPLNIKDSGNCSTLLSGSSGTVGHLIHLTLGMRENGFSGDGEPFGTNVAMVYCG